MHGPFLFHANALAYLLFGANDATSRIMPALTGCLLVLIPYLLREQIGRWGALSASFLLLISPGFLYYSRFIRHDIYTATASLLLFACIIRYLAKPEARWVYLGAVALIWALSNHEITYVVIFVDVTFLAAVIIWRLSPRLAALAGGTLVTMALTALVLPKVLAWPPLPDIPWQTPTQQNVSNFIGSLLTHPMIVAILLEVVAGLVAGIIFLRYLARQHQDPAKPSSGWLDPLFGRFAPLVVLWQAARKSPL